uniref:Uncharacterized protein n=1 Tax=Cacopsylla melanoneura TaxID=428564 RepID=A0A8D8XLM3_9HEMI
MVSTQDSYSPTTHNHTKKYLVFILGYYSHQQNTFFICLSFILYSVCNQYVQCFSLFFFFLMMISASQLSLVKSKLWICKSIFTNMTDFSKRNSIQIKHANKGRYGLSCFSFFFSLHVLLTSIIET